MIKRLILKVLLNKNVAPVAQKVVLKSHNLLYALSGILAIAVNDGLHPKHRLLRYKEWFLDHIEQGWVVLDIGSNTGAMPLLLAEKARHVYGIEIDTKLSEIAKQRNTTKNVEFLTGDATTYDYSACLPIDCVTLSNVLEHIDNRVDFLRMLRLRLSWSREDQRMFLIRVPTIEREWLAAYKKEIGMEYRLDRTHEIEFTKQEFFTEIEASGLKIDSFESRFGEYYAVCYGRD